MHGWPSGKRGTATYGARAGAVVHSDVRASLRIISELRRRNGVPLNEDTHKLTVSLASSHKTPVLAGKAPMALIRGYPRLSVFPVHARVKDRTIPIPCRISMELRTFGELNYRLSRIGVSDTPYHHIERPQSNDIRAVCDYPGSQLTLRSTAMSPLVGSLAY